MAPAVPILSRRTRSEMAASCCFVQFPHPGAEHRPGPSGGRAWNTLTAAHARKFMQLSGEWIDTDGRTASGDLWAWGEWEPQSRLLRRLDGPEARGYPQHLWHPYYVIPDGGYRGLHNTDPFIFGERFLYSNCKQPTSPRLRSLDRGSVIAFGSSKKGRWVLDTVLVVAGFVDYQQTAVRSALAGSVPETFLDVTGGPLAANSQHGKCGPALEELTGCGGGRRSRNGSDTALRLYWGATPQDPVHGMFSFFPAMPAGHAEGFPRPCIELPECCFTESLRQGHKQSCGLAAETVALLWDSLTEQVDAAGLVLGTRATLPLSTLNASPAKSGT